MRFVYGILFYLHKKSNNICLLHQLEMKLDWLVIGTLMKAVESEGGQDADEFAEFASRQTFPDGTNMLAMLHSDNYIKKFKTNEIMVTYGNTTDGKILLNKLNEMIAKERGVSVKDLAADPEQAPEAKTTKKADAKKTTAKK